MNNVKRLECLKEHLYDGDGKRLRLWDQDFKAYVQKSNRAITQINSLIKTQSNKEGAKVNQKKESRIKSNQKEQGIKSFGANSDCKNLKIHELNKLDGHNEFTFLIGSVEKSIQTIKSKLNSHNSWVNSVCFSSDEFIPQVFGCQDKSSILNKTLLMSIQFRFLLSPDSDDKSISLRDVKAYRGFQHQQSSFAYQFYN